MNKYSALISDFLHNCGDADKGFVNDTEWWIVNGSVKVQIFLIPRRRRRINCSGQSFLTLRSNPDLNEYVLKLNGTFKLKGVSFGIRNKHLVLSLFVRAWPGSRRTGVDDCCIAIIADEYDDYLLNEFSIA